MEQIEAELVEEVEAASATEDGRHVALYDGNEARHGRSDPQLAFMVEGFGTGLAAGGQVVVALQFGNAGRLSVGFEPDDAETLARIILGQLGRSRTKPN